MLDANFVCVKTLDMYILSVEDFRHKIIDVLELIIMEDFSSVIIKH